MFRKYLFLIIIIFLITALIIGYSDNLFSGIKFDKEGIITFEQKTRPGAPAISPQFGRDYFAWENFSKKDLLFAAWYQLKLAIDRDFGRRIPNLNFSFQLPGEIIKHNATKIEEGTGIWEGIPPEGVLILETRLIRWWLIILSIVLIAGGFWFSRQRKTFQSSNKWKRSDYSVPGTEGNHIFPKI